MSFQEHRQQIFWLLVSLVPAGVLTFFGGWGNRVAMSAGLVTALLCGLMLALPQVFQKKRLRVASLTAVAVTWILLAWGGQTHHQQEHDK